MSYHEASRLSRSGDNRFVLMTVASFMDMNVKTQDCECCGTIRHWDGSGYYVWTSAECWRHAAEAYSIVFAFSTQLPRSVVLTLAWKVEIDAGRWRWWHLNNGDLPCKVGSGFSLLIPFTITVHWPLTVDWLICCRSCGVHVRHGTYPLIFSHDIYPIIYSSLFDPQLISPKLLSHLHAPWSIGSSLCRKRLPITYQLYALQRTKPPGTPSSLHVDH
jgi:hypothetical protein